MSAGLSRGAKASCTRLFNQIIAEAARFPQANYRDYFGRLALEQKASLGAIDDVLKLQDIRDKAKADLEQMRRMVSVNALYVKNQSILDAEPAITKQPKPEKKKKGEGKREAARQQPNK